MPRDSGIPTDTDPTPAEARHWMPLGLGVGALLAAPLVGRLVRVLYAIAPGDGPTFPSPAMLGALAAVVLAGAGLTLGTRVLQHGDRAWPVWVGTVLSGLVVGFWVVFAVLELVAPH